MTGAGCGVLWAGAVAYLALVRPDAAGPWQALLAAGGWSLGLIPLHAVPAYQARPARRLPAAHPPAAPSPSPSRDPVDHP